MTSESPDLIVKTLVALFYCWARFTTARWRSWLLLGVGVVISIRAAVPAVLSALRGFRRSVNSDGLRHYRLDRHHSMASHHALFDRGGHMLLAGSRQMVSSVLAHPAQPAVVLVGGAVVFAATLFMLFTRGAISSGSPQDGDGPFGLITTGLGLVMFCVLVFCLHGALAAPTLSVTHNIVSSVINAA